MNIGCDAPSIPAAAPIEDNLDVVLAGEPRAHVVVQPPMVSGDDQQMTDRTSGG
jgi:hypothetical protein